MKPIDEFVRQMMASAERVRAGDPGAATDVIQRALQQAGLMTPAAPAEDTPTIIDINPAPGATQAPPRAKVRPRSPMTGARPGWQRQPHAPADLGPGRFIDGSFACPEGRRRYKLYVPAGAAEGPRPLVVMLHGCTQNADDFAAGTAMNSIAEEHGCLVLYPEQDRSANHNSCWNWFEPGQQRRGSGEPAILAAMTREILAEHGADPRRVYAAGLSAGGAMASILGAEYPELFAAIGIHSGLAAGTGKDMISGLHAMKHPPSPTPAGQGVPVIVFHGDADHVVNAGNGEAVLRQFSGAQAGSMQRERQDGNAGGRRFTRSCWRDAQGRRLAEHWLVHGMGHAWAGGKAAGSHTDASGPNASSEMLAFFLEHGR
ncbi:PHB depolymerase family esterase [Massilia sp. LC238]|uniref:extracellular catalytic domain type 1 short-chain-length polyhydroxyalkanoate depolymerase n=1 Tax=Massilia sp. LC238 TaxID=1502852 RepID=UPI0004E34EB1|nr:PHB depolymerase family esterase [Massilia sp. LC238]KFC71426.1 PHB depolymerase family esterase [Massilia sp. LC238]